MSHKFRVQQLIRWVKRINIFSVFVFRVHRVIAKYGWGSVSFLFGLFLGRLINELSGAKTLPDLWEAMFSVRDRPLNWSTWLMIAGIATVASLSPILNSLSRKLRYQQTLLIILERLKHPSLLKYSAIGVDHTITLASCPVPDRGWMLVESQVGVRHDTSRFEFPKEVREAYTDYTNRRYYEKKFMDDRGLIMLTRNPRTFTDTPTLVLDSKEVLFSQVLFFRERLLREKRGLLESTVNNLVMGAEDISFPHGVSMHVVVVTRDKQVLITKRSPKTEWYKNHWSCSFEENFSCKDLEEGRRGVEALRCWAQRALREELGLDEETYTIDNVRILSVFLESDVSKAASVLNIALCVHATLDIDHRELSTILRVLPRRDYEFTEFDFLDHQKMVKELINPERSYHPTSRYRMLLSLIKEYGEADFARRFLSAAKRISLAN